MQGVGTAPRTLPGAIRPGFIAWSMQFTDDKQMAIIHVVAADHDAFSQILADRRPEVRVFEIGKDSKDRIEKELRKYKKDFSLDTVEVPACGFL